MPVTTNVNHVHANRREYPNWNQRGRIKKVDIEGNILDGQYAFNGETVRISPRFQKNGTNYRVRPERPAAFFAAWCYENGILPSLLTADECQQGWALDLLDPLWEENKFQFKQLESPFAACDQSTLPSVRNGFSYNIYQVLVEAMGAVHSAPGNNHSLATSAPPSSPQALDRMKKAIEAGRAAAGKFPTPEVPPKPKK